METESLNLRDRARRAYEVGRILRTAAWSIPTLLLGAGVALRVHAISIPLLVAAALYAVSAFLSAASMALFTGAIAGGCVFLHGIVGMALGIAAGFVPMMVLQRLRRG